MLLRKPPVGKELFFKIGIVVIILTFVSLGISRAQAVTSILKPLHNITSFPSPTHPPADKLTASWKTYTNLKHNYSFKYPPTLLEIDGNLFTSYPTGMPSNTMIMATSYMKKSIYLEYFVDLNASVGTQKEWQEKGEIQTLVERFSLDSKKAIKIRSERVGHQGGLPSGNFILVDLGNDILSIFQSDYMVQNLNKYDVTFDQILSTFKFTQ